MFIMSKRLWIVLAVLVLAALGGLIIWKKSGNDAISANVDGLNAQKLLTAKDVGQDKSDIPDHYLGPTDAKVIVIEYEDFACVHCAQSAATFSKIMSDYQDRVLFIYRNFSLNFPNSVVSQSAAEAAYLLGGETAYWAMHNLLFKDDSTWTGEAITQDDRRSLLSDFAKQAGLDVDKFLQAVENYRGNGILDKMNRDKQLGTNAGVSGTPTWFINGQKIDDMTDSAIRKSLDDALKKAS